MQLTVPQCIALGVLERDEEGSFGGSASKGLALSLSEPRTRSAGICCLFCRLQERRKHEPKSPLDSQFISPILILFQSTPKEEAFEDVNKSLAKRSVRECPRRKRVRREELALLNKFIT